MVRVAGVVGRKMLRRDGASGFDFEESGLVLYRCLVSQATSSFNLCFKSFALCLHFYSKNMFLQT